MGAIARASSFSCSSSLRRKGRQNLVSQKDSQELHKRKVVQRENSFSSPSPSKEKKKQSVICHEESHDLQKGKPIRRETSFSSLSSPSLKKIKSVSPKKKRDETIKCSSLKSRIKDLGPICKRRKENVRVIPVNFQVEDDVDLCLDRQIKEEEKDNPDDCLWLSSGGMSPQELGLFMNSLDPSIDEWIISFVPNSLEKSKTQTPNFLVEDGAKLKEDKVSNEDSFWNMDRTGVWVSLINLDGEDSKWISEVDSSSSKELESDFPSPNYEINWDSYSSDVGFSSSARSTQETSQSEWSSELLSDSMDWELDSDDPIFWPFGKDFDWDGKGWDSFSVSPRKDSCKKIPESASNIKDVFVPSRSIRLRLHTRKPNSKEAIRSSRILLVSSLSASKIIGCKKGKRSKYIKTRKRGAHFKRKVPPPILENIIEEGKSPKESPQKAETTCHWDDDMDSDGPLFWPSDQKCAWDSTWDYFNLSPRKVTKSEGSSKPRFALSSSVRLRLRLSHKKKMCNASYLCASKSFKFKQPRVCKSQSSCGGGRSSKRVFMIFSNKSTEFKHGSCRKRMRAVPLKFNSVEEIMKLVYADVSSSEDMTIENVIGLDEFDGHEGVDPEFEGHTFSLEECMNE